MNSALFTLFGLSLLAMPQAAPAPAPERPPQVKALMEALPECSNLRQQLRQGVFGDGVERPYMQAMVREGVERAWFEVEGKWRHERVEKLRIVRRLFYRKFDAPDAQITDAATVKQIADSGLEAALDDAVVTWSKNVRVFAGIDTWAGIGHIGYWRWRLSGGHVYGSTELFASPWLKNRGPDFVSPWKVRQDLANAAYVGDVLELSQFLGGRRYSRAELNTALNAAVTSARDNTKAINVLIAAGADVNATSADGTTPLMVAYRGPCNIPSLLQHGARLDVRNASGDSALDIALRNRSTAAIRLLQQAAAKQ